VYQTDCGCVEENGDCVSGGLLMLIVDRRHCIGRIVDV
jgi:hypothetical protein